MADDADLFDVFDDRPVLKVQEVVDDKAKGDKTVETIITLDDDDVETNNVSEPPNKKIKLGDTEKITIDEEVDEEDTNQKLEKMIPRVEIHQLETEEGCLHEVIIPTDLVYQPLRNFSGQEGYQPAKKYEFVLDPFQKEAIACIENNQSVLVSAHTSAGKTVCAEYAIAQALREKQRVVYTTPIKALSNQKYREFYEEFKDVGLLTGDVTINPTASCLIMTTEILRLMLFRGSEIMREVGWVIFDEIHYMRDKERGVVWEETIILLPDTVHYVFLSATIPNARQFAEWISHLHQQTCHVVYTDYRPVPLQHYIFPAGGEGLHLVVDEKGNFKEENFNTVMSNLQSAGDAAKGDERGRRGGNKGGGESNCFKVIRTIMERDLAPVICFSFGKKECEAYALQMSKLDFNTDTEKESVEEVFKNAIDVLSEEDKKLPQVEHVLPLLKRGIGIHHGGLLPIIKETVEILFGEGLIKALFATETFAMGLNMPARTVVFTNARKFDGTEFRWLTSGEYIQMSGRAGRRGLDDKGIVILMINETMSPAVGKDLVKGKPDAINSAFHLTYNMVLNLLRVDDVNPEYMLQHSFFQFQSYAKVPDLLKKCAKLEKKQSKFTIKDEDKIDSYFKLREQLDHLSEEFLGFLRRPDYVVPFLQAGRLFKVDSAEKIDLGWSVLINFHKKTAKSRRELDLVHYTIEVLAHVDKSVDRNGEIFPPKDGSKGEMKLVTLKLDNITQISSARILVPEDLNRYDNRQVVFKSINSVKKQFDGSIPLLDPIEDMGIKDKGFASVIKKIEALEKRLEVCEVSDEDAIDQFKRKQVITDKLKAVRKELRQAQSLIQMDELKCRKRVLRRLGYCTATDVIEVKGRVACEITSGDELLLTEMLFNGVFNDLNVFQINALLSCFVFEEKAEEMPKLTEELAQPLRVMRELAKRIATVSREAKLSLDEQEYIQKFKPQLMDVVYSWSKGATFAQLCKMTDAFEGSIIRCLRRLEELLRQMCQAAKVIGNTDLENKFSEADKVIKRDIVFAASLYL
ncbi:ATP-dependent RNA helicase mtr4 [Halotydeus destructor]|nr:ATP-dependent RNA helicase mtr4 [Halotydeus destructor]